MRFGVLVEADVALLLGEDGVVPAHVAVLAGEPVRAALAEDDVAGDDELGGALFGAEAFAGALGGFVGAALGGVGGGAGVLEPVEGGVGGRWEEEGEREGEGETWWSEG